MQWVPPLLFGLSAGALTDRLDRRLIVLSVDLGRAAILALLTLAVATDQCFDRRGADALFVLTIFTFDITFGAAWSVLVLYATQRLGLGEVGFGLVTTVTAVGGLAGTVCCVWITRWVSLGT